MAGKRISGITGEIILKVDKWSAGIKQAQKDAKALESSLKPMQQLAGTVGKTFVAAGVAIGGSLLVMAKKAADAGDELNDLSKKTGIAASELAAYQLVANKSGTSIDGVAMGMSRLSRAMFEAATGSKEQAKLFAAMGVALKDSTGQLRDAGDVMPEIMDRFAGLEDGATKSALAMKLFGKSGADMIPFLNEGSGAIRDAQQNIKQYGGDIDKVAKLGDQFNDSLEDLKAAAGGLATSVGTALLPAMTDLAVQGTKAVAWASQMAAKYPIATQAATALSIALVGVGGLALAFSATASAATKAGAAILAMQKAAAAASILTAVRSYGDLSAAISLLGSTSIAAKAGLIGLAAAAGVLAGSLINAAIAAAGYQKEQDALIEGIVNAALPGIGRWITGQGAADKAVTKTADGIRSMEEALRKQGITVERGRMTEEQYTKALGDKVRALHNVEQRHAAGQAEIKKTGEATSGLDAKTRSLIDALTKESSEAKKATDEWAKLKEQFQSSLKPADDLEKTLVRFSESGKSAADIVRVYRDEIKSSVESQKAHGTQVSATMAHYYALATAGERLAETEDALNDIVLKNAAARDGFNKVLADSRVEFRQWQTSLEIGGDMGVLVEGLKGAEVAIDKTAHSTLDGVAALGNMRRSVQQTTEKLHGMIKAGRAHAEIMAVMGGELQQASDNAHKLGMNLDYETERILRQEAAIKKQQQRIQALGDAWAGTATQFSHGLSDITLDVLFDRGGKLKKNQGDLNRLAKEFGIEQRRVNETVGEYYDRVKQASRANEEWDEMFKHLDGGAKFFEKLGSLAKSTARSMLDSMVKGFIQPFTDKLAGLARGAGEALANMVFGGGGGGGLLGGLGGALGGLFGGSGQRSQTDQLAGLANMQLPGMGGGAATAAGGAGAGGGMWDMLAGIGGAAQVAGLAIDQLSKIGAGRRAADEIVKSQNAFVGQVTDIFDDPISGQQKSQLFESLWTDFQAAMSRFAATDPNNQKVVNQAFAELTPFITDRRQDLLPYLDVATPMGAAVTGPVTFHVNLTQHLNIDGTKITALQVRDEVAPELTSLLESGARGVREKWAQLLDVESTGTLAPVGI